MCNQKYQSNFVTSLGFIRYKTWIRVPFLTKEEIEVEGWKNIDNRGMSENNGLECTKGEFTLYYWFIHPRLKIIHTYLGTVLETNIMDKFSINEFRKLTKLLNV